MAKTLNFDLTSQSDIPKDGLASDQKTPLSVGQRQTDFSIPYYDPELGQDVVLQNTSQAQRIVDKINQYIENIADDYFLLGVHLIALHKLLKESKLSTDQIKAWYVENVNMPYSSAMQCKKVAEVYEDRPELINRYTASGAYLLSNCGTHEDREAIWQDACGKKSSASIRDLRKVLKKKRESDLQLTDKQEPSELHYKMNEIEIHRTFLELTKETKKLVDCSELQERLEQRKNLIRMIRKLAHQMGEVLS
ncbi:MAG: hypothetical protein HQM14_10270 [SAR324 cluster bacterium]|nr:hypothetical protein [SAR324 cluster bacterium]